MMNLRDYIIFKNKFKRGMFSVEDIPRLYRTYYTIAIKSKKDLLLGHEDFKHMLFNSKANFVFKTPQEEANFNSYVLSASPLNSVVYRSRKYPKQEKFANKLLDRIKGKNISNILEIGAGSVPFASICLAEKGYKVTAMDPYIKNQGFPDEVIANLGVKQIAQSYTSGLDLSGYDLIIGQNPCPVTPTIIKDSIEAGKPYFVEVCACKVPETYPESDNYNDEMVFQMWGQYLKDKYDSCIADVNFAFSKDLEL